MSSPDAVIHRVADRLQPLTLARAKQAAEGRANLIYLGDGATRIRERELFYDTVLETECRLLQQSADSWACIPVSRTTGTQTAFSDAACTQAVPITWVHDQASSEWPCMPRTPPKYSWDGGTEVRLVGEAYVGPLYATIEGLGCTPLVYDNAIPLALGPPATAAFMRATKVFD